MEIFASICLIIVIVVALMLVNRNVPDIKKNNSELFIDEQKHSGGGLSDSWKQLCVSNGIFDESEIEDVW